MVRKQLGLEQSANFRGRDFKKGPLDNSPMFPLLKFQTSAKSANVLGEIPPTAIGGIPRVAYELQNKTIVLVELPDQSVRMPGMALFDWPFLNPAHGSGRILQVLSTYPRSQQTQIPPTEVGGLFKS